MNARSVWITPSPPHSGQPPAEFALNRPAATLLRSANNFRIAGAIAVSSELRVGWRSAPSGVTPTDATPRLERHRHAFSSSDLTDPVKVSLRRGEPQLAEGACREAVPGSLDADSPAARSRLLARKSGGELLVSDDGEELELGMALRAGACGQDDEGLGAVLGVKELAVDVDPAESG